MVIRSVTKEDLTSLVPLMLTYIVDFYQRPNPGEMAVQGLAEHLLDHPEAGIQFVAELDGQLFGFVTLYFTFSTLRVKRVAILNDLFVAKSLRGQKVGESLFQHAITYIRNHGFAFVEWKTAKDNDVAQSLYNKMGGRLSEWLAYEME